MEDIRTGVLELLVAINIKVYKYQGILVSISASVTFVCELSPVLQLGYLSIPNTRWETISVNFVVELPESIDFVVMITIVNLVSKMTYYHKMSYSLIVILELR